MSGRLLLLLHRAELLGAAFPLSKGEKQPKLQQITETAPKHRWIHERVHNRRTVQLSSPALACVCRPRREPPPAGWGSRRERSGDGALPAQRCSPPGRQEEQEPLSAGRTLPHTAAHTHTHCLHGLMKGITPNWFIYEPNDVFYLSLLHLTIQSVFSIYVIYVVCFLYHDRKRKNPIKTFRLKSTNT